MSYFDVIIRDDFTPSDLSACAHDGVSVMKTPHVGNMYPNNLIWAKAGIPMVSYDRNIGKKDSNFHPHCVIKLGSREQIARDDVLVSHATIQRASSLMPSYFKKGMLLSEAHMMSLRKTFPASNVQTFSEYLLHHRPQVLSVLQAGFKQAQQYSKFSWERYVWPNGTISFHTARTWNEIIRSGIYGITSYESGWIVPLGQCILLAGAIESCKFDQPEVIHPSGPDMVNYIKKLTEGLNAVYSDVSGLSCMPNNIKFILVPVADMRFAVPSEQSYALDQLVHCYCTYHTLQQQRNERVTSASPKDRKKVIQECDKEKDGAIKDLRNAIQRCPDIFYDITEGNYVSQYDLRDSSSLYIADWATHQTFATLSKIMKELVKLRKRV